MKEKLVELKLDDIKVGKRHRPIDDKDDEAMLSLAEGIKTDGLIQPITVYKDNQLVTGARRLFAHVINEADTILAIWKPYNDIQAERAEILENMDRKQLTALQDAQQTLRLQELYMLEHEETKHGGDRKSEDFKTTKCRLDPFTEDTARKVGKTPRTIERSIKLARDLDPDVQKDLKGTPIEDKKAELTRLAKLPVKKQKMITKKLVSGEITRVPSKPKPSKPKPSKPKPSKPPRIDQTSTEFNASIELFATQHAQYVKTFLKTLSNHPGGQVHPSPKKAVIGQLDILTTMFSNLKNRI